MREDFAPGGVGVDVAQADTKKARHASCQFEAWSGGGEVGCASCVQKARRGS